MVPALDPTSQQARCSNVPSSSRISLDDGQTPMWTSMRGLANLVGRCLIPRPAPSPPLSFSFCLFEWPSERSASLPSPAGIENASPSRPLAAPLTTPFLVDLHEPALVRELSQRLWTWAATTTEVPSVEEEELTPWVGMGRWERGPGLTIHRGRGIFKWCKWVAMSK
jgi:hypothetical protein